jgi:hypothetical protein
MLMPLCGVGELRPAGVGKAQKKKILLTTNKNKKQ